MKISLKKFIEGINDLFPPQTAMEGDRIGLQVYNGSDMISNILVTLELNPSVIDEARQIGANLIVAFHPLIYRPLAGIDTEERVGGLLRELIKSDISLFVAHTNFDAFKNGTSKIFADRIGCETTGFLVPDKKYPHAGIGIIGNFPNGIDGRELIRKISEVTGSNIRYCRGKHQIVRKIAIVGGSGSSFLNEVMKQDFDAFITADVSYHTFHAVNSAFWLIDPGHYEMEQFVPMGMKKLLENYFGEGLQFTATSKLTNPVQYYPRTEENYQAQLNLLVKN